MEVNELAVVQRQKLRPSLVYLNARQYGLSVTEAYRCATTWADVFDTCFTQRVVGPFYKRSKVAVSGLPSQQPRNTLFLTAHFSAYSFISIVLAHAYKKRVNLVVGKPPQGFEECVKESLRVVQVEANFIRSDFSQLRKIQRAIVDEEIVISLFDVPWHRMAIPGRKNEFFRFGCGEITASRSIFKIADRLHLTPSLVLCRPQRDGYEVRSYGPLDQQNCFLELEALINANPGHYERFCDLHEYYSPDTPVDEIATFELAGSRFIATVPQGRLWRMGKCLADEVDSMLRSGKPELSSQLIERLLQSKMNRVYRGVAYL